MVTLQYVPSTELQQAIAVSNPARTGAAGRAQVNQSKLRYWRSWAFYIEANTSILVNDLTFNIEDSSMSIYEFDFWYRRFFDIEYYWYRRKRFYIEESSILGCFNIEVLTFDIKVSSFLCALISKYADFNIEVQTFDIEVTYRTRYQS